MDPQKVAVLEKVRQILSDFGIEVSIKELTDLINSSDWDQSAKEFNQKIDNISISTIMSWKDYTRIDELLATIDPRISPGGYSWSSYNFVKNDHGHGLFTFRK